MIKKIGDKSSYSLNGFERAINGTVRFFFYYRMIWVILAILAIALFSIISWDSYDGENRVKNVATILTCGSIILGIFYAILTYEINYFKYRNEEILKRKQASFQIASEWHKDSMVANLKKTKKHEQVSIRCKRMVNLICKPKKTM